MTCSHRRSTLPAAVLSASLALLLGACAPSPESAPATSDPAPAASDPAPAAPEPAPQASIDLVPDDDEMSATCDAEPVQGLIGQEATEATVTKATADSGSATVRVLKPGDAATMDFRPDRLNVHVDDAGLIESLRCG